MILKTLSLMKTFILRDLVFCLSVWKQGNCKKKFFSS